MIHLTIHEDSSSIKYKSLVAFLHNEKIVFEQSPVLLQTDVSRSGLFGHYEVPLDPNSSATYSCPANIPQQNSEQKDDEVTHGQYFGENIRRVIKALK